MTKEKSIFNYFSLLSKLFFLLVICIWLIKYYNGLLLHQLAQPVLPYPGRDPFYWIVIGLDIPQLIVSSNALSLSIDLTVLISATACLFFEKKKVFNWIFTISYFIYFFVFNTYLAHHYHSVGVLFISLMFFSKKNALSFSRVFEFVRYYFFFMLCSAFLWKLVRGNLWNIDHFSDILKVQHIHFFQAKASSWKADLILYLINHEFMAFILWIGLMLLQATFFVGFFTKKYDSLLLAFYAVFLIGSWLLMNILNLDNLTWIIALLPFGVFKLFEKRGQY